MGGRQAKIGSTENREKRRGKKEILELRIAGSGKGMREREGRREERGKEVGRRGKTEV